MAQKIRQDIQIGKTIRKYRKRVGLTQDQVTAKLQLMGLEITRSSYSQIECGTYNIRVSEMMALSKLFQVGVECFFEDIDI